jgi:galactose mutarotase-like enzyme
MFFVESPHALRARPTRYGCPVLFPFPGYARDARYRWNDQVRSLPINAPDGRSHVHGFAHDRPWEVVDHRKNAATLEFWTRRALSSEEREAYPFDIVVRQVVSVSNGTLDIVVEAENRGDTVAPVGLGLHPYFDPVFLETDRNDITVTLPGSMERVLDGPVPTGKLTAVPSREHIPGEGGTLVCRTALGMTGNTATTNIRDIGRLPESLSATLRGRNSGAAQMDLRGSWSDVVLFVPPDQPSVAIEPLTCALSAASQVSASPDSLPLLAPGERVAGGIRLRRTH